MLAARQLTKRYGSLTALDALDLEVKVGEVYCLLGANGAGKSTTINLFLNFVPPSEGTALVCGIDVTRDPIAAKRRLAYIPETVMLYPTLTALENLGYFAGLSSSTPLDDDALRMHLRDVGLQEEQLRQRVGGFSKGMRQKVGIAIAVAVNALERTSAASAVLLLGSWLLVVVIIPSSVAAIVSSRYPTPSRVVLTTQAREASDRASAQGDTAVNQFLTDHPEMFRTGTLASSNAWGRTIVLQERTNDALRPTYAAFDSALSAQHRAAARASLFSPAVIVQEVLHDLAGRSFARYRLFETQLDTHHQEWQAFFFRRVFGEQPFTREDLVSVPRFVFAEEAIAATAARALPPMLAVLLPTIVLLCWGWWRLGHLDGRQSSRSVVPSRVLESA